MNHGDTSRSLWDVPEQPRAAAVLRAAVQRGEVGHAWAFLGVPGVGQAAAARSLVAALNCRHSPACGVCGTCSRALRGTHPGYHEFVPTGAFHRVSDVRETWLPAAFTTAAEGGVKVLRIVDADRMNDAAANAFLKGLEEPPASTVWILDIADPDDLPDTITSRCRVLRFRPAVPAALEELAGRLGLQDDRDRALAVRAAMGSPVALRRLAAPRGLADYRAHRELLTRLRVDGPGHALVAAHALAGEIRRRGKAVRAEAAAALDGLAEAYGGEPPRAVVKEVETRAARQERDTKVVTVQHALDDMVTWIRDCLIVGRGDDEALVNLDAIDDLRADRAAIGTRALLRTADRALHVRESLEVNVQPALAVESFLLSTHADLVAG